MTTDNRAIAEQQKIEQMNIIIGQFMEIAGSKSWMAMNCKYHSDWNLLMGVVEKIEAMGHKTIVGGGDHWGHYCNIMFGKTNEEREANLSKMESTKALGRGESKKECIYNAVYDFIFWYNQNNKA